MSKIRVLAGILIIGSFLFLIATGCATKSEAVVEEEKPIEKEEEVKEVQKAEEVAIQLDSDGDGVVDDEDRCPDTPAGVEVDENGCPFDSDGDGVYDYLDRCPDSPPGVKVDENGCPEIEKVVEEEIIVEEKTEEEVSIEYTLEFDINSAEIRPVYYAQREKAYELVQEHPDAELVSVVIEGYSDSTGSERHNYALSRRRAETVKEYLVKEFGIDPAIIEVRAFGESNPIASNKTKKGRQKNRRVVITFTAVNI